MSVSLSIHRVDRILVERRSHEAHHWTKLRMVDAAGGTIFEVDVFGANSGAPVEVIDERPAAVPEKPKAGDWLKRAKAGKLVIAQMEEPDDDRQPDQP